MTQSKGARKIVKPLPDGQITIPAAFREALGIDADTPLSMRLVTDHLEMRPLRQGEGSLRLYTKKDIDGFNEEDELDPETAQGVGKLLRYGHRLLQFQRKQAFLDATVFVAATRSPSGGSALAMEVCKLRFRVAITDRVLDEVRWNILERFGEVELMRFYQQRAALNADIFPPPPPERLEKCIPLTGKKNAHALAAALACGCTHLLTLDRRRLLTSVVQSAELPLKVVTPGEFLGEVVAQR